MDSGRKRILIIEDDSVLRNMLSDHLGRTYEIAQAEDGEQGLGFILDFKPDLVLLDLLLPKLSGLDMLHRLRDYPDKNVANTKVIIFSNFSSQENIMKAQVLNVSDYFVKANTDINDLVKKIEAILTKPTA